MERPVLVLREARLNSTPFEGNTADPTSATV